MSWASRRRTVYVIGVTAFFAVIIGVPLSYWYFTIPTTCTDGIQNQGETAIDKGGPCIALDPNALHPATILWSRSFKVRDGSYTAAAYIQNANDAAGVRVVGYRFGLYDADNVLVAERDGTIFVMPGGITPVVEPNINTGNRIVVHTYLEFTEPLLWQRMSSPAKGITISNKKLSDPTVSARLTADALNKSVSPVLAPSFVAVLFDQNGNAFAASRTAMDRIDAGAIERIVFTWPDPFPMGVGRVDIIPLLPPIVQEGLR